MSDPSYLIRLILETRLEVDPEVLIDRTLRWTKPGERLRGALFLRGETPPKSATKIEPATAYELVCFAYRHDGALRQVDWRKCSLVAARGTTYKSGRNTRHLCLQKNGLVVKTHVDLRSKKVRELMVAF